MTRSPDQPDPGADDAEQVAVELAADPQAPGQARRAVREALGRWQLPSLVDRVLLVVSELVTNGVRYGRPPLRLVVSRRRQSVRVEVHDAVPGSPPLTPVDVAPDEEHGRGLQIVSAVADDVGVEQVPGDGKTVHASFDT